MINNIPNKLLKDEPKDKNDNVKEAVSVENIKIEEIDSSKFDTVQYSNYNICFCSEADEVSNPKQSQDSGLGKTESAENIVDANRRPSNISSTADGKYKFYY